MNSDDTAKQDEEFDFLLARADELLAKGNGDLPSCVDAAPSELRTRLQRELAWCQHVRQFWPRAANSTKLPHLSTVRIPSASTTELSANHVGRFQILRELGRGGFGVVFLAYDPRLKRELALKVPREATLFSGELRARFQQEARVAANLDHSNIVPVYEAGEADGICYIASAYCPGIDLAAWLRQHPEPVLADAAASLMKTVAEAVAHAHERGVLHRDLKPGNILLQKVESGKEREEHRKKQGSTQENQTGAFATDDRLPTTDYPDSLTSYLPKITDFGLAKLVEEHAASLATNSPTRSGAIIGTPGYMAPEQADGSNKTIGPTADLFSLGTILYEMLTGRPPFQGDTPLETLLLVRTADPVQPRRLRPKLARDLETICLKCLAKEVPKRYATARALAEDLRRFLAREPIQARPTSVFERAKKWARRRPALAVLASVSAVAGVAIFLIVGVANVRLQKERDIANSLREDADLQRQRAVTHLREAREAVDRLLTRVGFERLKAIPHMQTVRRDLLNDALQFYQGFAQYESDDPEVRFETGRAWRRLGNIHEDLGDQRAALQDFRNAQEIQAHLLADFPDRAAFREELASCYNNLGNLLWKQGAEAAETRHAIDQALDLQNKLVADFPESARYRQGLAESYDAFGRWLNSKDATNEAEEAFRHAVKILEGAVAMSPQNEAMQSSLASRRRNLATFLARRGRLKEAEPVFRADLEYWLRREAEAPADRRYLGRAADASKHLGALLISTGKRTEGEVLVRQAIERLQRLTGEYPNAIEHHEVLASALEILAQAHRSRNEFTVACSSFEQAIAQLQICDQIRTPPSDKRIFLGSLHWQLADLQLRLGAYQAAAKEAEKLPKICFDRWEECYQAARLYTRCVPLAKSDKELSEKGRQADADHFSRRSVELLREAFRRGYRDIAFVKKDGGLEVLRSRDDFKKLVQEQSARAGP